MYKIIGKLSLIWTISLTALVGCESLDNGGGKDWVQVQVTVEQPESTSPQKSYSASLVQSAAIFAVPASVTLEILDQIENAYDGKLQNLVDGTVTLTVPLNESLKLVKFAYTTEYTLDQIINDDQDAYGFGISDPFTITGSDEEKTINITMMTGDNWGGTVQYGTAGFFDAPTSLLQDSSGNIYLSGYARGDLDGQSNQDPGTDDVFITKFSSSGVKQWTRLFGSIGDENPENMIIDSNGDLVLTGSASAHIPGAENSHTSPGTGPDVFLAKYDTSGNKVWTRLYGTGLNNSETGEAILETSNGKYILVGFMNEGGWTGFPDTNGPDNDIYILQVENTGTGEDYFPLARPDAAEDGFGAETRVEHALLDSSNNIYITGRTAGYFEGSGIVGGEDAFLLKRDSGGDPIWSKQIGTSASDSGVKLVFDTSGNIYLAGQTGGAFVDQTNAGGADYFIGKYSTSDGSEIWFKQFGSSDDDNSLFDLKVGPDGNLYFLGATSGDLPANTDTSNTTDDILLGIYSTADGSQISIKQFGTAATDWPTVMAFDSSGYILMTGVTFGSLDGTSAADSEGDSFLLKLDSDMNILTN